MRNTSLSCFRNFRCLAGACPDTCCAGWEIDLDEAALAAYARVPGSLGEELRESIRREDGYTFFALKDGRCPFLNEKGLCRLILRLGEGCLSTTCREHPRFVEEYGPLRETCLSISCPEAARLLLEEPLELVTVCTPEQAPEEGPEAAYFQELYSYRQELLEFAASGAPLETMLTAVGETVGPFRMNLPGFWRAMEGMEFTSDRLPKRLKETAPEWKAWAHPSEPGSRLLGYFLYRYVLRAVWDGLLREKVLLSVYSVAAILTLAGGEEPEAVGEAASLYSREVEHSDENLALLYSFLEGNTQ